MNLMSFFKRPSSTAPVARERLQILLAHERAAVGKSNLIAILQEEILAVITKHVPVEPDCIKVKMERGDAVSTLEVEVEIPTPIYVNLTFGVDKPLAEPEPAEIRPAEMRMSDESAEEPAEAGFAPRRSAGFSDECERIRVSD